mmetsp:Transcript_49191/g.96173  ORF Transcript_49191/g.96173 Transcript_49191/m.96173 type:complete len:214 (+) Transcript_49191:2159-2800(+)
MRPTSLSVDTRGAALTRHTLPTCSPFHLHPPTGGVRDGRPGLRRDTRYRRRRRTLPGLRRPVAARLGPTRGTLGPPNRRDGHVGGGVGHERQQIRPRPLGVERRPFFRVSPRRADAGRGIRCVRTRGRGREEAPDRRRPRRVRPAGGRCDEGAVRRGRVQREYRDLCGPVLRRRRRRRRRPRRRGGTGPASPPAVRQRPARLPPVVRVPPPCL